MTIDYLSPRETASLVVPSKAILYPQAKIDTQHHQLKHRISTRNPDTIYFCCGYDICALQTTAQKRELIKSLPWVPKCLDAGFGWICVGGDEGRCAFTSIVNSQDDRSRSELRQRAADVDEQLPLDLEESGQDLVARLLRDSRSARSANDDKYNLRYHTLGKNIVNSVAIHRMQSARKGFEDEIVVLATNNDKTVQIFSLSQSKQLVTLTYTTPMNHASMSPDGNLILAVGDKGQAFFHRRIPFENPSVGDKPFMAYGWMAIGEPLLHQVSDVDACFSTGFSPSGHRCVVASEHGIITVLDTSLVNDEMEGEDAVICIMKTSRPSTQIGAARSLSFSPSPWDLLAIAEDQGRVIVFDLRTPEFLFRQTLELSIDLSDVVLVECSDNRAISEHMEEGTRLLQSDIIEHLRETRQLQERYAAAVNSADELEHSIQRQNIQADLIGRELQALVENAGDNLLESSRQVAESVGIRRSQSHIENPGNPNSTNTTNGENTTVSIMRPHLSSAHSLVYSENRSNMLAARDNMTRLAATFGEMPSTSTLLGARDYQNRSSASMAEYMHQRSIERERQRTSDRQPRRRSSVVITNSNSRNSNNNHSTLAPIGAATPTLSTSPSRIPSSSSSTTPAAPISTTNSVPPPRLNISATTPEIWQSLSDDPSTTTNSDISRGPIAERAARARRIMGTTQLHRSASVSRSLGNPGPANDPRWHSQGRQAALSAGLSRADPTLLQRTYDQIATHLRESGQEVTTIDLGRESQSRAGGVIIQGIGFSQDGRSLFVGTESGMLEYEVNIRERMQWPGVGFL